MSALRDLLTGGQVVAYYPALARAVGGIAPALFLQQLAHWERYSDDGWVFRTQEELEQELAMSSKVQATCRKHLIQGRFITEERRAKNKLHYKIDWNKVEAVLQSSPTGKSRPAQRESLDLPNGQNSLIRHKDKNQETTFPQADPEPQPEDAKKAKKDGILTEQQELTNDFYNRLRGRYRVTLEGEQYAFHLGQFRNMLKKYDDATEEEKLRVIAYMVDEYPAKPRIRAPKAMEDVRLGRDTGEAWQGEAPWEKAKRESEPNPYKNIRDFTLSSKPQPKKQTEEEKLAIMERMEKMRREASVK